jgi:hypothetical protein
LQEASADEYVIFLDASDVLLSARTGTEAVPSTGEYQERGRAPYSRVVLIWYRQIKSDSPIP